jgi:tetratricopeptide (TPR) repeat protein
MNEHISWTGMEQGDLACILPLVQKTLQTTLSFETLHWLPCDARTPLQNMVNETGMEIPLSACTKLFGLSDRQRKRIADALCAKQPFWDAIGHNVFLPIQADSGHCCCTKDGKTDSSALLSRILGVLAIQGVNRLINLEEAGRWLQLLQDYIQLLVQKTFQQALISQKDADGAVYPPFLQYFLKKMRTDGAFTAVVHVSQTHGPSESEWNATYCEAMVFGSKARAVCLHLWPAVRLKYLGGDRNEAWFAIFHKDRTASHAGELTPKYDGLASGLKRFWQSVPCAVADTLSVYLHFDKNICLSLPFILQTEFLARQLGAHIFSSMDTAVLQRKTGAQDMSGALRRITSLPDRIKAAAFISGGADMEAGMEKLMSRLPAFWQTIPSGQESAFIISHTETGDAFVQPLEKAVMGLPELDHIVMGIAYEGAALKAAGMSSPAAAAVYACLHASLLPESHNIFHENGRHERGQTLKKAVFDALTLHVAGDELFAMGDMNAACKMFKKALSLASRQDRRHGNGMDRRSVVTPALLNSLGITLQQTGRRAAAVRCFEQALQQFPEDVMAYYNLSGILLETKQFDKAEELLRKAAKLAPEDIHITIKLANCLFEKQDTNAAMGLLAPFMTKGLSELPAAFFKLQGRLGLEKGNWSYAKENLNKALVRTPYDAEILFFLAKGYMTAEGDSRTARRLLKQAELLTSSKRLHKMLANLKRKTETMP